MQNFRLVNTPADMQTEHILRTTHTTHKCYGLSQRAHFYLELLWSMKWVGCLEEWQTEKRLRKFSEET